jgi:TetR/AcrR family transcriptional regulator, mexJK operon transcriptional repressor
MSGGKDDSGAAGPTPQSRRGRPRKDTVEARRDEILSVAMSMFMQEGFAATMEGVAAAARMSKRTLYARYPDKVALFQAVLAWLASERTTAALSPPPEAPLEQALMDYGLALFEHYATPQVAGFLRLMQKEQERFPHLDRVMREEILREQVLPLKGYLDAQPPGRIRRTDTLIAAKAFVRMVIGEIADLYAGGPLPPIEAFRPFLAAAGELMVQGLRPPGPPLD